MARLVTWDLRIDWARNGTYVDESARLVAANGAMELAAGAAGITATSGIVDRCQLTLDNRDGRYSPYNTAGPLYASIQNGGAYHAPMYLRVSINGGGAYARVFTGVIKIPQETGPTARTGARVEIECRSRDELLLSKRMSTLRSELATAHVGAWTEAQIMASWLTGAALSEGSDYVLDEGLFVVPWAWLDDESPIEEIWTLAAACGGRFYADPDGILRYENAAHWLYAPHTVSQATLGLGDYSDFEPQLDDRELFSGAVVEISERAPGAVGALWHADDVVVVPANSTVDVTARMRQPAYAISGVEYAAVSGGGTQMDASISISRAEYAQRVELGITNSHATHAANLVVLALYGTPVDGRPSSEAQADSADAFWSARQGRTRTLRNNVWVQTRDQGQFLADFLRDRLQVPRLSYNVRGVPGVPGRRLGDRVTLSSPVLSSNRQAIITRIVWRLDSGGFVQDYGCLDAAGLYPDAGYFVINSSAMGGAAVLFY